MDAVGMPTLLLLVGLLMAYLNRTGSQVGVCYGTYGNDLPSPAEIVDLCKSQNITRMRLYAPDEVTLDTLRDSDIELVLGVPNTDLQGIASSNSTATDWVKSNVIAYWPSVRFRYIAVGNDVSPSSNNSQFLLLAMQNIYDTIESVGIQNQIKVSTAVSTELLGNSYPPSHGVFRDDVRSFIDPIVLFLVQKGSPLLANVYPYFVYSVNPESVSLSYALFISQSSVLQDSKLEYQNLFDSMVDAFYSALEKVGGSTVEIVVSESGWPSGVDITVGATIENARAYNSNLIQHVKAGTPKRPGKAIETNVFSMFDENQKSSTEQHWGLFFKNQQPKYPINSSWVPTYSPPPSESTNPYCLNYYITMYHPSPL